MEKRKCYNYENEISHHNFLTKSAFTEFYNFCDFVLAYEEQMGIPPEIERALPFYRQDNASSSVNHTDEEEEKQLSSSDSSTPERGNNGSKGKADEMDCSNSSSANSDSTSDEQEEEEEPKQPRRSTKRKNTSNQRRSRETNKRQNRSKKDDSESDGDTSSSSSSVSINNDVELVYTSDDESWNLVTCFCRRPFAGRPMIECSKCLTWIHLSCAKIKKQSVPDVFICQQCKLKGVRRSKRKKT